MHAKLRLDMRERLIGVARHPEADEGRLLAAAQRRVSLEVAPARCRRRIGGDLLGARLMQRHDRQESYRHPLRIAQHGDPSWLLCEPALGERAEALALVLRHHLQQQRRVGGT